MEFEYHARKAVVILEVVDPPIYQHCNILSELMVINKSIATVQNCLDITVGVLVKVEWQQRRQRLRVGSLRHRAARQLKILLNMVMVSLRKMAIKIVSP